MKIKLKNAGKKEVREGYEEFMQYSRAKNLSGATLYYYRKKLTRFIEWVINEEGLEVLYEISNKTVQRYIIHLKVNYNLNDKSINTHLRAVKVFLNYCNQLGYVNNINAKLIKTQDKVKETYTNEELEILLKKPNIKKTSFAEYRTWVVINWLLATGNRLGTIVNIKIKDLDSDNELIFLNFTKNNRAQIIPMSITLNKVLQEYLMYRKGQPQDYLFCNEYGHKLSKSGMVSAIKRYHKQRGVPKQSIHMYRHTFAKLAIMRGIDPLRLQKILGHSTLDMTRKYVNLFGIDLKEGFNRYSPLEQFSHYKESIKM